MLQVCMRYFVCVCEHMSVCYFVCVFQGRRKENVHLNAWPLGELTTKTYRKYRQQINYNPQTE